MSSTKEEIGATCAAAAYALAVLIGLLRDVSLGEAALRGGIGAVGALYVGQFLGGIWIKASRSESDEIFPSS